MRTFWPTEADTALPEPAGLPAFLDSVAFVVPARTGGRSKEHREGHCIIRALRWLGINRPELFPATLKRGEAPDFIVQPRGSAQPWSLEHTDAGEPTYQKWLAQTENEEGSVLMPSPDGEGWLGDAPERAFDEAIRVAAHRKSASKYWDNGPTTALRCILVYDQTNAGLFVSDAHALGSIQRAVAPLRGFGVMLLRGTDRVLVAGIES